MSLLTLRCLRSVIAVNFAVLATFLTIGCAETSPIQDAPPTASPESISENSEDQNTVDNDQPDERERLTEWDGDSPDDVFFDRPMDVVLEGDSSGTFQINVGTPQIVDSVVVASTTETPNQVANPQAGTSNSPSGSLEPDWQRLASVDVLNAEVKRLRNQLTANLKTIATYNRNLQSIANDSAVMAAIAAVIGVHSEALSWQADARYVRDLAAEMASGAVETGREPYSQIQRLFEQIISILNGGPPPDTEAPDTVPFSHIADRSELMKRTKHSFEWLKSEINTTARFSENPEEIVREATVLAIIGGLISTESYDSADEPAYQGFAREFIDANLAITEAVQTGDFEKFTIARDRVQNACAACHGEYAFGDEGL